MTPRLFGRSGRKLQNKISASSGLGFLANHCLCCKGGATAAGGFTVGVGCHHKGTAGRCTETEWCHKQAVFEGVSDLSQGKGLGRTQLELMGSNQDHETEVVRRRDSTRHISEVC